MSMGLTGEQLRELASNLEKLAEAGIAVEVISFAGHTVYLDRQRASATPPRRLNAMPDDNPDPEYVFIVRGITDKNTSR